jgi:hypothetical protein
VWIGGTIAGITDPPAPTQYPTIYKTNTTDLASYP